MIRFLSLFLAIFMLILPATAFGADEASSIEDLLGDEAIIKPDVEPTTNLEVTVGIIKDNGNSDKKLDIGKTGLPLPRFVSLKRDVVNVRKGPNESFDIAWTFTRKNLPVEIIAEYDNWRKVRDHLGAEGWIFHSLLSGARYALINPWKEDGFFTIHDERDEASRVMAKLEAGILGRIAACDGIWCQLNIETYQGYIKQEFLWGVYLGDIVK